ncbi:ATP-dependent RNA helicase [uncultured Corynebacterium sp.]|uniref:ATP-dependent RNA helicase n=1 Tax=uncultured Corynebacterium sp. TaxID=159447 RepID=UPI0026286DB5|nr:ATP-dependent helicase C-terminal domain-containing protein [uncultured Corynebacterium sp.]
MTVFDVSRIGAGLPFTAAADELSAALDGMTAVVQAPPGTGKTTVVPPVVANHAAAGAGRVLVTAPRRVAVRAAARRLAELSGEELGGAVGYTVRGDRKVSRGTRVEFATPGVVIRRLLRDGDLPDVSAVVLDEVHERDLDTDILLGMLRDLRELREDMALTAMSATVDAPRFAALLGGPIVAADSVLHPLDVRWAPSPVPRLDHRGVTFGFLDHVAATAAATFRDAPDDGDVLVFLPGVREVDRVAGALAGLVGAEILTLHGRLGPGEQDRVVRGRGPEQPRRIIVATAIAESSLTVPGVRAVVDACLSRGPRMDLARGMSGLVTTSCARSSAEQRAGRAARLGPGIAVRCIAESDWAGLDAWPAPEIAVADLTRPMLDVAAWGTPGAVGLPLPDVPPPRHVAAAHATLAALGALELADDGTAALTDFGRVLAQLPLEPRLGRALLAGAAAIGPKRAADAVAILDDAPGGDVRRLRRLAEEHAVAGTRPPSASDDVAVVAALAWPDRIGRRRGDSGEFLFTGGTAATAPAELRGHEWLAVADVGRAGGRAAGRSGAVIRSAAPASRELAEWAAAGIARTVTDVRVDRGAVTARRRVMLGAIELSAQPLRPGPAECREAWLREIGRDPAALGALFGFTEDADVLRRRLALLHRELGDPWPDVSDAGLAARAEELLGTALDTAAPGPICVDRLRGLLPWPEATRLDELAPARLPVPSGSAIRVDYPEPGSDAAPLLAVKLQECFGLADTPALVDGRVPVVLHLLSPAGRPLAVTGDLRSFWDGPYAQVRAEMRGRYPKHPWPEDPWTAQATKRTKR